MDGSTNLFNHIIIYQAVMHLKGAIDEVMCHFFAMTLKKGVRILYHNIHPHSIKEFD